VKNKILKQYIYEGLGFPVVLTKVKVREIRGEEVPDINYNDLQKSVLLLLCHKKDPLTGQELKFIRKYLEMTTTEFGNEFGCSHTAVLKWEKYGDHFARVEPGTEVCIRLFALKHIQRSVTAFKKLYDEISISHLAERQKNLELSQESYNANWLHYTPRTARVKRRLPRKAKLPSR
jgi:DNA-binding transcriptional regulator YiaG